MKITVIIALKGVSFNHHTLQLFTKKETPVGDLTPKS